MYNKALKSKRIETDGCKSYFYNYRDSIGTNVQYKQVDWNEISIEIAE